MTAETSREGRVAWIIRIRPPSHLQIWKYVAIVDCQNRLPSLPNILGALTVKVREARLVETYECIRKLVRRFLSRAIIRLKQLHTLFLDERQRHRNISKCESLVHGTLGQVERVRWAVVAIHALHVVFRQTLHGIFRCVGTDKCSGLARPRISGFDPWNSLAGRV